MRVRITNLKAPWPDGSRVGSVVELSGDALPAWAVGKFVPAGDSPVTEQSQLDALAKHHEVAVSALKQDMADQARDHATTVEALRKALGDLQAEADSLKAKLAEAPAPKADSKAKAK